MSSWLVSLRCIAGCAAWRRRCLEKHGLGAARRCNRLFNAGPCRLVAEFRPQIIPKCCDLVVIHAVDKSRHDRAALALHRANSGQYDVAALRASGLLSAVESARLIPP